MGMDGLGGDSALQSKIAVVSPSSRPDADVDYTFIQIFPEAPASLTYKMNCGNISAGVPVFALMKNMVPDVKDGLSTIRVYSTNTKKMMYLTVDVLNGEAKSTATARWTAFQGPAPRSSSTSAIRAALSPASSSLPATSWTRSRWTTGPRSVSRSRTW
jgi:2-methylaconitate cis-trans-isomerase PrpF